MKTVVVKKEHYGEKYPLKEVLLGKDTTLQTNFSACYTESAIKVRFEAEIGKPLFTRNHGAQVVVWESDCMEVFLSPYADEGNYFEFDLAPDGSYYFAKIFNPDGLSARPTPIETKGLIATTNVTEKLWVVEMEIPFSLMVKKEDLARVKELPWRFNAYRIDDGNQEYQSVCPTGVRHKITFHVPKAFGKLQFE